MILRRDHVAGGIFVLGGALVFALSGDLPWGSMSMPGAGMMPKLALGLMIVLGLVLIVRAGESPPFAEIEWGDLPHAILVTIVTAVVVALYTWLGFILAMSLLMFVLLVPIERQNILYATAYSIGITVLAYVMFSLLLKAPLPRGLIGW
jgi:putative tricarboxylic transport membrane protein